MTGQNVLPVIQYCQLQRDRQSGLVFANRVGKADVQASRYTTFQRKSLACGHMYAYLILYMSMKRTALFLKEQQLEKLQTLSRKTGAPIAELVRRAIDAYLLLRKNELK
jgi:hypothetical protein